MEKLIEMGVCGKPHGIKGGFTFKLHNEEQSILQKGFEILLVPSNSNSCLPEEGEAFIIESISFGNKVIVYLKGICDRNRVEAMIPFSIMANREDFPALSDGEIYLGDLIDLAVFDAHTGNHLGKIVEFYDNGAQIVLTIDLGNRRVDLPFIDQFVPTVDIEQNRVEVFIPEVIDGR